MQGPDSSLLSELIGDIYEASYQPANWTVVIEKIARLTQSKSGALFIHDRSVQEASGFHPYGLPEEMLQDYARLGHGDPGFSIMQNKPVGEATNIMEPQRHALETPEYHETLRLKYDLGYVGGANVLVDKTLHVGLGLHRSASAIAYEDETLLLLSQLIPHLQRALRIHREFIRLKIAKTAMSAGFDSMMIGLVLFDHLGQPVYVNPVAEAILADHPAIERVNNNLVPTNSQDAARLRGLILSCMERQPSAATAQGGVMGLRHPDRARPLAVLVKSVAASELTNVIDGEPIYAAMYLTDSDRPVPLSTDAITAVYGLTPSEAKVAVALTNGLSVEEIARSLNRSVNTIRSHLRSLFQKTHAGNQTDLVRLLLTGFVS